MASLQGQSLVRLSAMHFDSTEASTTYCSCLILRPTALRRPQTADEPKELEIVKRSKPRLEVNIVPRGPNKWQWVVSEKGGAPITSGEVSGARSKALAAGNDALRKQENIRAQDD
jgi:hypothetical protein